MHFSRSETTDTRENINGNQDIPNIELLRTYLSLAKFLKVLLIYLISQKSYVATQTFQILAYSSFKVKKSLEKRSVVLAKKRCNLVDKNVDGKKRR